MNTVEEHLRAAARAAIDIVPDGSAPPLTLPGPSRRHATGGWHPRRRTRWLAPLAAAAAVAAVAAGLIAATGPAPVSKPRPGGTGPADGRAIQATPRLADGLPAYFLAVPEGAVTGRGATSGAVDIVSTATGRTAMTVALPGSAYRIAASRGGSFYAAVLPRRGPVRFYRIAWPLKGGATAVTLLPIRTPPGGISTFAASPDGSELAIATYVRHGSSRYAQDLTVASTRTGRERHWSAPPTDATGSMESVGWLADNRTVALTWRTPADSANGSVRLLDTTAPGTNVVAGRSVLAMNNPAGDFGDFAISGNGKFLIGVAGYRSGSLGKVGGQPTTVGDVIRFSARTGQASVLYRPPPEHRPSYPTVCEDPLWVSPSGGQTLVTCVRAQTAGQISASVLLLGGGRPTRLHQLEPVVHGDVIAFGS